MTFRLTIDACLILVIYAAHRRHQAGNVRPNVLRFNWRSPLAPGPPDRLSNLSSTCRPRSSVFRSAVRGARRLCHGRLPLAQASSSSTTRRTRRASACVEVSVAFVTGAEGRLQVRSTRAVAPRPVRAGASIGPLQVRRDLQSMVRNWCGGAAPGAPVQSPLAQFELVIPIGPLQVRRGLQSLVRNWRGGAAPGAPASVQSPLAQFELVSPIGSLQVRRGLQSLVRNWCGGAAPGVPAPVQSPLAQFELTVVQRSGAVIPQFGVRQAFEASSREGRVAALQVPL